MAEEPGSVGRRAVVRGAVWSVPVVAAVTGAPAFAASTITPFSRTVPGNKSTPVTEVIVVPPGVRFVNYVVVGGDGAGGSESRGGNGALLAGVLDLGANAPGVTLTIIPGGGGTFGSLPPRGSTSTVPGGAGYGNGGATTYGFQVTGYSGGGGSAVLVGPAPLVVAGGGGGAGNASQDDSGGNSPNIVGGSAGVGGDAGPPSGSAGSGGQSTAFAENRNFVAQANGGGGASGATGGAGASATGAFTQDAGIPGGSFGTGANGGGNGGAGRPSVQYNSTVATRVGSAGGGGGYAGGGGGATASLSYGANNYAVAQAGGAAGGGSSFVGTVGTITPSNNTVGSNPNGSGANGYISISWG